MLLRRDFKVLRGPAGTCWAQQVAPAGSNVCLFDASNICLPLAPPALVISRGNFREHTVLVLSPAARYPRT